MRKTVVAILSVEDETLENGTFETEMGCIEESGIYLRDYTESADAKVTYKDDGHVLTYLNEI